VTSHQQETVSKNDNRFNHANKQFFAQTAARRPMVGGGGVRLTAARRLISVGGGGVRNSAARRGPLVLPASIKVNRKPDILPFCMLCSGGSVYRKTVPISDILSYRQRHRMRYLRYRKIPKKNRKTEKSIENRYGFFKLKYYASEIKVYQLQDVICSR
jgi:hypothetical protein